MDCPVCGITNPSGALKCDCGYDFQTAKPSATPGWQINLAWRQKLAAYWLVSWRAWVSTIILEVILAMFFSAAALARHDYRTFRIYMIRDNGRQDRNLSMREAILIWVWMLGPQLALLLGVFVLLRWYGSTLPPQTVQSISTLALWLRFFAVGPYATGLALRARYPAFRLQAYGFRYI